MSANDNKKQISEEEKHFHHVLGGYKATLNNSASSEEARQHAQDMIDFLSESKDFPEESTRKQKYTDEEKHLHHVIGGYKATLANSASSEEARKHAQEMLDNMSSQAKEHKRPSSDSGSEKKELTEEEKHRHHVEGGYKATLNNANASDEAKLHAQEMLQKIAKGEEVPESSSGLSNKDATDTHVAGGYKATLANPNASEEAKKHAREMLEKAGVDPEERLSSDKADLTEEEKHRHHVEGGYKATLNNANASDEAKKHASEMLDKLAKGEELPESEKRGQKRSSDEVAAEDKESAKGKQGFAAMPKEKVQEIASMGGRTAHAGEEPAPKKAAQ